MKVGSLFTGIGGLDLGLERAGMTVIWQSEIDPYASRVLKKHYPHVPNLGDITEIDWSTVERPDLICGGFPCQPFSQAGSRKGADDPRHLWPHFARCLRLVRPEWALLENVPGLLTLGFGEVAADLADLGYDLEWECIPAAAVGAPHLRYRIFVVAHTGRGRHEPQPRSVSGDASRSDGAQLGHQPGGSGTDVAHTASPGLEARDGNGLRAGPRPEPGRVACPRGENVADTDGPGSQGRQLLPERAGQRAARTSSVADTDEVGRRGRRRAWGNDSGRPEPEDSRGHWSVEPDVGRVANGVPRRVDRLRCLGNAVVPQVAELVGRMILEAAS